MPKALAILRVISIEGRFLLRSYFPMISWEASMRYARSLCDQLFSFLKLLILLPVFNVLLILSNHYTYNSNIGELYCIKK